MRPILISRRRALAGAAALAWSGATAAVATEPDAEQLLDRECAAAGAEGKSLLIAFFASWCVWCRPMDRLFADANAGPILERHFRVLHFRVGERDSAMRALQHRGAEAAFLRITRPERDAGLPYLAILAGDGRTIATSRSLRSGENIGFPVTDDELDWFESMLRQGAAQLSPAEILHLRATCQRLGGRPRR